MSIDETSCRLLAVHQIGWSPPRRQTCSAAGQREAGHDIHGRFRHGPWPTGHAVHASKRDAVLLEQPWPETTLATSRQKTAGPATTTILQLAATLDDVLNPSKEGQAWILLWDMTSIHASEATLAAMKAKFPHVVLCFIPPLLPTLSSKAPSTTSSRTRHGDDSRRPNGQLAPSHGPLRQKPGLDDRLASLARPQRRRIPRGRDGASALHARDELGAWHITPELREARRTGPWRKGQMMTKITCRLSRVSCPRSCFHVLTTSPKLPDSDRLKHVFFIFHRCCYERRSLI